MRLRAADLFCGAGGTSQGAKQTGSCDVVFALNHWHRAIQTHSANFPGTVHVNSRLEKTSPSECGKINLLFASPECTHHSRARGKKPTSDQQRAGAWYVMPWIEHHRPSWIVIENVTEFRSWGPVDAAGQPILSLKGKFFDAWIMAIRAAGYRVDDRDLNAADLGAATSRNRMFIVARKGNRNPVFPEPTHSKKTGGELPGMALKPWRAAAEVIDWSIPCPSIFSRKEQLADTTLLRIEAGLRRFAGPFTMTTKAIVTPFILPRQGFYDHRTLKRSRGVDEPLPTITASHVPGAVVTPFMLSTGSGGAPRGVNDPVPTIVTVDGTSLAVPCFPWLSHYYGTANQSPVNEPLDTITTKERHSLCVAICRGPEDWPAPQTEAMRLLQQTMRELGVCDIGFRMLSNPELSAAQGFPSDYIFHGKKKEVTRQIGNSVSPAVAQAITQAILSV